MNEKNPAEVYEALKLRMRTLQLATLGENNEPHCGYTPFIHDGKNLIIFVSQLAVHTRDLLVNPTLGTMLIDDEQDSNNLFARCRVRYQCEAQVIKPDEEQYTALLDRYQNRHGKVVIVIGFGEAYRIEGDNMDRFVHVRTA